MSSSTPTCTMLDAVNYEISLRESTIKASKKELESKSAGDVIYRETAVEYAVTVWSLPKFRLQKAVYGYVLSGHGPKTEFMDADEACGFGKGMMTWEEKEMIYRKRMAEHTEANIRVPSERRAKGP
ncbi:hypothetical protein G6011_09627 [Alternaria panax]|uniref:Uncharacterized protein n=1 Tax=Alternaria panax TaxID=48097 RepID=A0AAD4F9U7_9PLEO|nr:hypothetical protein G6011_09627 [Alternaria panax]